MDYTSPAVDDGKNTAQAGTHATGHPFFHGHLTFPVPLCEKGIGKGP